MSNDDDFNENNDALEKALDAVEEFDEEVALDPHLKRALRHLTTGLDELKHAMRKRGLLPMGKH